jgi:monofunctional biosynthetic peptidoglycan transglycosylase
MARKRSKRRRSKKKTAQRRRRLAILGVALALALALLVTSLPILALRWLPPPTTAFMLRSRTADPATGESCLGIDYQWVPLSQISPQLPISVLVAEDQRFLTHRGFDFDSIVDAVEERLQGGRMRGASTVSQQVAKNLFLWPGKSIVRKSLEAWLTLWVEMLWPKRRIIEVHVNIAQFGPCVFGAEAASRRYFARSAAQLRPMQAALLAAVLPDPQHMRADDPGPFTRKRAAEILAEASVPGGPVYLRGL